MQEKESVQKFTSAIVLLAKIFPLIKDEFFAKKFYRKLSGLIASYVEFSGTPGDSPRVAQCRRECLYAIKDVLENLEYFLHLQLVEPTPLLLASHAVLRLRLELMGSATQPVLKTEKPVPAPSKIEGSIKSRPAAAMAGQADAVKKTVSRKSIPKLSTNQEKIFNFIKKFPDVRTKDLIGEFSAVSERTVKRSLKELVRGGLLRRRLENKAVHYSVADSSA